MNYAITIAASVAAAVLFLVCCVGLPVIVCCVLCCKVFRSRKAFALKEPRYPKFRVVDAPNPALLNKSFVEKKDAVPPASSGNEVNSSIKHEDIRERSPAQLPIDAVKETTESHSYALPNEIRFMPFQRREPSNVIDGIEDTNDDSETAPIRRHRASTDSQLPRMDHYGSTSCADYTSPVSSASPPPFQNQSIVEDPQSIYMTPATNEESLYIQIKSLNVPSIHRDLIEVQKELGSGNFGCVMQCIYSQSPTSQVCVAAKTLKQSCDTVDKIKFLQEAAIMGQFHHKNIVKLYGVVVDETPLMIVLELMSRGDLRHYLVNIKPDEHFRLPELLVAFCREVASGMEYLSSMCFIHRDLAARNILLDDKLTCKIGDFGLARDLMDEEYYIAHGGVIPVKWTAPEALNYRKYSTASDVWSYGCLMYEVWSLGHKPYGRRSNKKILEILEEGTRLHPPPGCTRPLYHLMIQCWHPISSSRLSFSEIVNILKDKDDHLLSWSDQDRHSCVLEGRTLGSSLSTSENLFIDLQLTYTRLTP